MQPVEEFMREFLRERVAEERREQASRAPFRQKYYSDDCFWESRVGVLEKYESETLVSTSCSGDEALAITTSEYPSVSKDFRYAKLRYHLEAAEGQWKIRSLDFACRYCKGEPGCSACIFCNGQGWISSMRARGIRRSSPPGFAA
jgi:hypothetical protein